MIKSLQLEMKLLGQVADMDTLFVLLGKLLELDSVVISVEKNP